MLGEQHYLQLRDGIELNCRIKEAGHSHWLILTHGIGENLERHQYILSLLSGRFNIFLYDLRGHGLSGGKRAYVESFDDFVYDLEEVTRYLSERFKMKKFVFFGHSMGALITCGYMRKIAKKTCYPELVYLSSPPVGVPGALGKIVDQVPFTLINKLSMLPASLPVGGLVNIAGLSHDIHVKERYIADEKNSTKLHSKLLLEVVKASRKIFSKPLNLKCPGFVSIGTGDNVVSYPAVVEYFSTVEKNFTLKIFHEAYHEIHNEVAPYQEEYFAFLREALFSVFKENTNGNP